MSNSVLDDVAETAGKTLGERAVSFIRRCIEDGRFPGGARLPAEQEMAEELSVSRTTVRSALDRLESEGYLKSRKGRGRVVVRRSGPKNVLMPHTVLFLTSLPASAERHRMSGWMEAVELGAIETSTAAGWHALKLQPGKLDDECIRDLLASKPAGMVVTHDVTDNEWGISLIARLHGQGMPLVVNGDWPTLAGYDRVVPDHETGAYELTRWLIRRGNRRILRVWSANESDYWVRARTIGHERAMREAGLDPLPPVWVKGVYRGEMRGRDEFEAKTRLFTGYLVEWLQGGAAVDAIMATTDPDVFCIAAACRRLGRRLVAPGDRDDRRPLASADGDVALVGYDNNWHACPERVYEPALPLASVDKNNHRAGQLMAELLLDRTAGRLGPEPQRLLVAPEVVELEHANGSANVGALGRQAPETRGENQP